MQLNEFGTTGLKVSEVGFGGSRIGGVFAAKDVRGGAVGLLQQCLDAGITFYDTADMYSQGESEALIGKAFRNRRAAVVLATKGGFTLPARRNFVRHVKPLLRPIIQVLGLKRSALPKGASGALSQDFTPAYLTAALEASLTRLRTDHVDLYQLHSPSPAFVRTDEFGAALQTLEKLKAQGKLRFYGIGTEHPEDAAHCVDVPGISSLQLGFGVLDQLALDDGTLDRARGRGLAIIARGCFGGGLLKDGTDDAQLRAATGKWRQIIALRSLSAQLQRPTLDVAFQFCRGTPGVAVSLLGMHRRQHLDDNLRHVRARRLQPGEYAAVRALTSDAGPAPESR